jgi:hypothetical protein
MGMEFQLLSWYGRQEHFRERVCVHTTHRAGSTRALFRTRTVPRAKAQLSSIRRSQSAGYDFARRAIHLACAGANLGTQVTLSG